MSDKAVPNFHDNFVNC